VGAGGKERLSAWSRPDPKPKWQMHNTIEMSPLSKKKFGVEYYRADYGRLTEMVCGYGQLHKKISDHKHFTPKGWIMLSFPSWNHSLRLRLFQTNFRLTEAEIVGIALYLR